MGKNSQHSQFLNFNKDTTYVEQPTSMTRWPWPLSPMMYLAHTLSCYGDDCFFTMNYSDGHVHCDPWILTGILPVPKVDYIYSKCGFLSVLRCQCTTRKMNVLIACLSKQCSERLRHIFSEIVTDIDTCFLHVNINWLLHIEIHFFLHVNINL